MKITKRYLRKLIKEEFKKISEREIGGVKLPPGPGAGSPAVDPAMKKRLGMPPESVEPLMNDLRDVLDDVERGQTQLPPELQGELTDMLQQIRDLLLSGEGSVETPGVKLPSRVQSAIQKGLNP